MSEAEDLAGWLRGRSAEQLAVLLEARPQLQRYASRGRDGLRELAARVLREQEGSGLLHALSLPERDLLNAALSLAEGEPVRRQKKYQAYVSYPGGASRLIEREELLGAVAGDRPEPRRRAEPVVQALMDRLLLWPGREGAVRVPMMVKFALDLARQAPTLDRAWTNFFNKAFLLEIAAHLDVEIAEGAVREQAQQRLLAALADPERVQKILAAAPAAVHHFLDPLLAGPLTVHAPCFSAGRNRLDAVSGPPQAPDAWLARHGLLVPLESGRGQLPREIARALGGAAYPLRVDPPTLPTSPVPLQRITGQAQSAASAAVTLVEVLLKEVADTPAALRKSGGLAVRDTRRIANRLDVDQPQARFWIDLAVAADLLGAADHGGRQALVPTARYQLWLQAHPALRLTPIICAWASTGAVLTWTPPGQDPAAPCEAVHEQCVAGLRRAVLAALSLLPEGHGAATDAALRDLVHAVWWQQPRCSATDHPAQRITATLREAELLGVIAYQALSPTGRALLAHLPPTGCPQQLSLSVPQAVADSLTEAFPAVQDTALFQSDLTAVVPGLPGPQLVQLLDAAAEREARGHASVWRFSPASVRRALDGGTEAGELLAALRAACRTELPQPLEYLLADVARRHGGIRVARANSVLHSDDVAVIAELAAAQDRRLRSLELRQIAPTVLLSALPAGATLQVLREAGYAPAPEDNAGLIEIESAPRPQARTARTITHIDAVRLRSHTTTLDLAHQLLHDS